MSTDLNVHHKQLYFETKGNKISYFEIKEDCLQFIEEKKVQNGILVVQSPHTTCAVFFEEMVHDLDALQDEFLQHDFNKGLNILFPKQRSYDDEYKYPGPIHREFGLLRPNSELKENPAILLNGDAHCKATLVGSDVTLLIQQGKLIIGTLGSLYFVDFDGNRKRKRSCHLCILGE